MENFYGLLRKCRLFLVSKNSVALDVFFFKSKFDDLRIRNLLPTSGPDRYELHQKYNTCRVKYEYKVVRTFEIVTGSRN